MRTRLMSLLTLGALCAGAVLAQGQQRGWGGTPPDPAQMVQRRVQMLTKMLSLTDAQATQATTIFTNAANAQEPIRAKVEAAHEAFRTAIKENNGAGIDDAAATVGTLTGQMMAINGKADAAFYGLLTADQRARYDQMGFGRGGFGGGGGDRMRGGRMGGPGPGRQ